MKSSKNPDDESIDTSLSLEEFIEFIEGEKLIYKEMMCDEEVWDEIYRLFWTVYLGVDVSFLDRKRLS